MINKKQYIQITQDIFQTQKIQFAYSKNNIIVRKLKKSEKGKNNTKQKVTTNETLLTTKIVQYAQKKYV